MAFTRQFRLKVAELVRLLGGHIFTKLNSHRGLIEAKLQLWKRVRDVVKERYPEAKWTYTHQMREWESHPLQRYIRLVELRFPLPDPNDGLTLSEWKEYLIWKSDNHQGIKEWKRYGRSAKKKEDPSKGDNKKQTSPPQGARAYVPGGKKRSPELIQIEAPKKR
jgi:hypothetical protein